MNIFHYDRSSCSLLMEQYCVLMQWVKILFQFVLANPLLTKVLHSLRIYLQSVLYRPSTYFESITLYMYGVTEPTAITAIEKALLVLIDQFSPQQLFDEIPNISFPNVANTNKMQLLVCYLLLVLVLPASYWITMIKHFLKVSFSIIEKLTSIACNGMSQN